jgi:hypothetical protein
VLFLIEDYLKIDANLNDNQEALIKGVSREAARFVMLNSIFDAVGDKFTGEAAHKGRQRELSKLEILMKKKQLGIPYTDDDLDGYHKDSLLDQAKIPAMAALMQKTRPSVFAGVADMMMPAPVMMPQPVMVPVTYAPPITTGYSMPPMILGGGMTNPKQVGLNILELGKKAGGLLSKDLKKGLISSIIKSLK